MAQADLLSLYDWIAAAAGRTVALRYTAGIEARLTLLAEHPLAGAGRDDLGAGIRTLTYRRRTTVAYRMLDDAVEIVRLAHAGRDLGRMFSDEDDG